MKSLIRKFGLSLVPAMALTALLTACGEDGKNGVDGAPGEQGATGESGKSCTAKPLADDSGYTLTCGNEEVGVIRNGVDGVNGKDGAGCMAEPMANGDYKISCGGVVVGVLFNGNGGSDGQGETGGTSCSAKALADGSGYTLTCGGVKVGTISNGRDGYSCRASQNADKTVTTITCETADGEVSYEVANGKSTYEIAVEAGFQGSEAEWLESLKGDKGDDGVSCEVSRNGYELTITCANSKEVVDLRDFIMQSSTSETNSSTSEEGVSSSSVTPGTVPGSNSSSSEEDVSSSSVTPDPVPGSNSSSSEVKPDGYYSNSSNCPAGLTCKYATTTDYLNSSKTYGEILDTRDGQVYKTIEICDKNDKNCQTWMAQNLNYVPTNVSSMGSYAWSDCYGDGGYDYSSKKNLTAEEIAANCATYGRLYTWAAAVDSVAIYKNYGEECGYGKSCTRFSATALATAPVRGVCPSGWHLPSDAEWSALYTNVGGTSYAGQKLKANSSLRSSNTGTDEYGFSVLPAGYRSYGGDFDFRGFGAYFWSSTEDEDNSDFAWSQVFNFDYVIQGNDYKGDGFSVRCLKDSI